MEQPAEHHAAPAVRVQKDCASQSISTENTAMMSDVEDAEAVRRQDLGEGADRPGRGRDDQNEKGGPALPTQEIELGIGGFAPRRARDPRLGEASASAASDRGAIAGRLEAMPPDGQRRRRGSERAEAIASGPVSTL